MTNTAYTALLLLLVIGLGCSSPTESRLDEIMNGEPDEELALKIGDPVGMPPMDFIRFSLPTRCWVKLEIWNATGYTVQVLIDEELDAGIYEVSWDARKLKSGIYLVYLEAGDFKAWQTRVISWTPDYGTFERT